MRGFSISEAAVQPGSKRSPRDQKLELCVKHIFESEGIPAFCENVNDIMARTLNLECNSMELARVILKDLGLTSQILRIANSALYNRSGRTIMSVAHAISLLGWETVRNMLSAIRYIEHFAKGSPGLRELMLASVLNAVHCRDLAAIAGYPYPDEAYICGLFRNLGEVLVACHYPHEYARIILAMHTEKIPARAACLRHLDFSWDDLGRLVADAWNMPRKVAICMQGPCAAAESAVDRSLTSIIDYGHELTHTLYRKGDRKEAVHLRYVADPDGARTLISVQDLTLMIDCAARETSETFAQLGIPKERLLLERQAERARQILESTPVFSAAGLALLDQAIDTARAQLARSDFELTGLIASLLDAVAAVGFDGVVFGLLNENHTVLRGRLASKGAGDILARFCFPLDRAEGLVRAALVHKTDVLVDRARDDRYDRSTLVTALDPGAFALFPVVTEGRAVACIYAQRGSPSPGLSLVRSQIGRVRDVIGAAVRKKAPAAG